MGNFDGRGDTLNLKSDKGGEPSSLISRVKHLLRHTWRIVKCYVEGAIGRNPIITI